MNHCLTDQVQVGGSSPLPVPGGRLRCGPAAASPVCQTSPDWSLAWPFSVPPPVPVQGCRGVKAEALAQNA